MITLKEERLKKRTFQPKYKTEISHRSLIQKHIVFMFLKLIIKYCEKVLV